MDILPWEGFYQTPQLARWHSAMPQRFSCRSFSSPPDLSQTTALEYAAQRDALLGVRIVISAKDAGELVIHLPLFPKFEGVSRYAVVLVKRGTPMENLLAGISGQAFALELASMGLAGCWIVGNYRRSIVRPLAREGEIIKAVIPFGMPADPEGARFRKRKPLAALCRDEPAKWPLWAYRAAEAVRSAPSAMNRQPWKLSFTRSTLCFTGTRLDSINTGIAVMHMECAVRAHNHEWRLSRDGKSLLLQVGESDESV